MLIDFFFQDLSNVNNTEELSVGILHMAQMFSK